MHPIAKHSFPLSLSLCLFSFLLLLLFFVFSKFLIFPHRKKGKRKQKISERFLTDVPLYKDRHVLFLFWSKRQTSNSTKNILVFVCMKNLVEGSSRIQPKIKKEEIGDTTDGPGPHISKVRDHGPKFTQTSNNISLFQTIQTSSGFLCFLLNSSLRTDDSPIKPISSSDYNPSSFLSPHKFGKSLSDSYPPSLVFLQL